MTIIWHRKLNYNQNTSSSSTILYLYYRNLCTCTAVYVNSPLLWQEQLDSLWQCFLQPHFTSSRIAEGAGLSRHFTGDILPCAFFSQPLSVSWSWFSRGLPYNLSLADMKLALWICDMRVFCVGGSSSPSKVFVRTSP